MHNPRPVAASLRRNTSSVSIATRPSSVTRPSSSEVDRAAEILGLFTLVCVIWALVLLSAFGVL